MKIKECLTSNDKILRVETKEFRNYQETAKKLCCKYNKTKPSQDKKRKKILNKLLGDSADAIIKPNFKCDYGFNIHFKGFALINYNSVFLDTSPIYIGNNVLIAPNCVLTCAGHAIDPTQRIKGYSTSAPIIIEDDVWIGASSTILAGVKIGKGSIIGAGSLVNKDIPPFSIAVGNPCKVLRKITENDKIKETDLINVE